MPANVVVMTNTNAIHPFRIDIPEPELADLRAGPSTTTTR
jgi:hypothetical protein